MKHLQVYTGIVLARGDELCYAAIARDPRHARSLIRKEYTRIIKPVVDDWDPDTFLPPPLTIHDTDIFIGRFCRAPKGETPRATEMA